MAATNEIDTFERLLVGFSKSLDVYSKTELKSQEIEHREIATVIAGYTECKSRWNLSQKLIAESFNILDVLKLTGNEVRHSMVLAWLLDKDIEKHGTHAQGCLGFEIFLNELKLPPAYANADYWVLREVAGDESRMDIEIAARGNFLIHVENKIWSTEGEEQTLREWNDLKKRSEHLNVPKDCVHCIFLSPSGEAPAHEGFTPLSWYRMKKVLDQFSELAAPPEVQMFARHYARSLSVFGIAKTDDGENKV